MIRSIRVVLPARFLPQIRMWDLCISIVFFRFLHTKNTA